MAGVPADARLEVKFVTSPMELDRLQVWLRLHPAAFRVAFPDRWVNNLYLDTQSLSAYCDNMAGISQRTKLRYRWYGSSAHPVGGNLEVKYRQNCYGWKRLFPVEGPVYAAGQRWSEFRDCVGRRIGGEGRLWLKSRPHPVLVNRYYRRYFVSGDGVTRVTIDTRWRVYDQRYAPHPNLVHAARVPEVLVLELKCHQADRERTAQIIQGLPITVGRHSKYAIGVKALTC